MENSVTAFRCELEKAGLQPNEVEADGQLRRCPTRDKPKSQNGWHVLFSDPPAGAFGDWANDLQEKWCGAENSGSMDPETWRQIQARIEIDKKARQEQDARKHAESAEKARKILEGLPPVDSSNPYLSRKNVKACKGLKADKETLVVPVYGPDRAIMSLQQIEPDGGKKFLPGGKTCGGFFVIRGDAGPLYVGEGLATCLSIHEATGQTVLCAFNAINLKAVAEMARKRYPDRPIIIAADDDLETESRTGKNPGQEAALQAAWAVGGEVALPSFQNPSGKSDFNDMAREQGLEAVKAALDAAENPEQAKINDPWPEPVMFDDIGPPSIPPESLPNPLREYCDAVAVSIQVPFELPVMACLGVLAASAQGKYKVELRPGYQEPLCIYSLTPLPPGERKSAALEAARRPLATWEREKAVDMASDIRRARSEYQTRIKAIEKLRARVGKEKTNIDEIVRQVQMMEEELPEVPLAPRLLCDDVTPEALAEQMSRHNGRAAVIEAEGGLFEILGGLYTNGRSNLNLVLKSWSNEETIVDRKSRDGIRLYDPALTLCLSPQPEVLSDIANMRGFRGRGLLGRFLYCMPRSVLGGRVVETGPIPIAIETAYRTMIFRILNTPWAQDERGDQAAHVIRLSAGALRQWVEFSKAVEVELREGGQFETLRDWAGKLPGQAARIAGLYHVAFELDPVAVPISESIMRQSLDLAAVLADHARAAFSFMGSDPAIECGQKILHWIIRDNIHRFTARDAYQTVKGTYPKMDQVNPGLRVLEDRYYIRRTESESRSGPGRKPSPIFDVNPYAHNSHNPQNQGSG